MVRKTAKKTSRRAMRVRRRSGGANDNVKMTDEQFKELMKLMEMVSSKVSRQENDTSEMREQKAVMIQKLQSRLAMLLNELKSNRQEHGMEGAENWWLDESPSPKRKSASRKRTRRA